MKITLENQEYEIDIERAKQLGLCKEVRKQITSFKVGDVLQAPSHRRSVITAVNWCYSGDQEKSQRYNLAGIHGLNLFSNFGSDLEKLPTYEGMLEYLNSQQFVLIGNINDEVATAINNLSSPF